MQYEGVFVRLQKVVVRGFRSRNHFSQQSEIVANFTSEYTARIAEWDAMKPQAETFQPQLEEDLGETHQALDECMTRVRSTVTTDYERIIAGVPTCEEFNN
jgi:hypothetical protein